MTARSRGLEPGSHGDSITAVLTALFHSHGMGTWGSLMHSCGHGGLGSLLHMCNGTGLREQGREGTHPPPLSRWKQNQGP